MRIKFVSGEELSEFFKMFIDAFVSMDLLGLPNQVLYWKRKKKRIKI